MKKIYALLLLLSAFSNAQIIDIPDANFKSVLLSSSPASDVATNAFDNHFAIDANGDGEIQVSEALEVTALNVTGTALQDLTGIEAFENLITLLASNCQITSFNYSLPQLLHLHVDSNVLTTMALQGCPLLVQLDCNYNNLTVLDLDGLSNLEILFCRANNIEVLNLGQMPELHIIDCYGNLITDLDFSGAPNLQEIECSYNELEVIDISSNPLVGSLHCDNNEITYVNLKNGVNTTSFIPYSFFNNPITNVCVDVGEEALATTIFFPAAVSPYCTLTPGAAYNTIQGIVKLDSGTDGCDVDDMNLPFLKLRIIDGVSENYVFTTNGQYTFYTQGGDFTIMPNTENPSLFNFSPASATVNFAQTDGLISTVDFCGTAVGIFADVEAYVAPLVPAQPGFNSTYQISYKNKGNQTVSGSISLNYEESLMDFVSTSFPGVQSSGTLTWDFENLQPFENRTFTIMFNINSPVETPPVNNDDILNFQGVLTLDGITDQNPADNTFGFLQRVVGSFDPNDKICLEGDVVSSANIGNYLHYIINFENVGTAPAHNVVVRDVINASQFDISSLQLVSSSHPVVARQTGNVAEFIFENIMLDSGGHGNILLKIKTLPTLSEGAIVSNKADIYFDYNAPVITELANTQFQSLALNDYNANAITFYPNPTSNLIHISAKSDITSILLFDVQGRVLQTILTNGTEEVVDVSQKSSGVYFVKVITDEGTMTQKIIKN